MNRVFRVVLVNILFGLSIILVLMLGESDGSSQLIRSDETRVAFLILLAAIPPLFAAGQVCLFHYRFSSSSDFDKKFNALGRVAIWHFVVWLLSSVAIVVLIQWQFTVRSSWQLDRFPAIDEFLILAPSLVSLIVSWFILFETQSGDVRADELKAARKDYVSIRCRVYLLLALVPIAGMILVKDFWYLIESLPVWGLVALICGMLVALLALMPWLIGRLWTSRSASDDEGRERMLAICQSENMGVKDVLVWNTNNSLVNALVAGVFPRYRVLMVSDLLLATFPNHEVDAILRHEAGHLRLAHLPIRMFFILLPAMAMVAMELDPNQTLARLSYGVMDFTGLVIPEAAIPASLFVIYLLATTAWLSRMMEFEADLYAAGLISCEKQLTHSPTLPAVQAISDALCRFGEGNPDQMAKSSLTHPSLRERLELIKDCSNSPNKASEFRRKFFWQQLTLTGLILILTSVVICS